MYKSKSENQILIETEVSVDCSLWWSKGFTRERSIVSKSITGKKQPQGERLKEKAKCCNWSQKKKIIIWKLITPRWKTKPSKPAIIMYGKQLWQKILCKRVYNVWQLLICTQDHVELQLMPPVLFVECTNHLNSTLHSENKL